MFSYRNRIINLAIMILIVAGCSGSTDPIGEIIDPANFSETTHKLSEVLLIEETDEFFFGQITNVQPTSKGHILVGDGTAKQFHVFDTNGNRIGVIGKEGSGPGEFQQMGKSYVTAGDTLLVMDWSNARITAFTEVRAGSWERALEIPMMRTPGGSISGFYHLAGQPLIGQFNQFVMPGMAHEPPKPSLAAFNRAGEKVGESIANYRHMDSKIDDSGINFIRIYSIPFGRSGQVRESDEALHIANTEIFGATTINTAGDTLYHFEYPVITRRVSEEMITNFMERTNTDYSQSVREEIPETRPAFDSFQADNHGNLYFRFDDISEEEHLWLVFTSDGEFLKSFRIIKSANIMRIKDSHLYCSGDNDGEPLVRVYRIDEA